MLAAVIFDCDGVLFDSWRANVAFYNAILCAMERPPMSREWETRVHVMAAAQVFDAMFAEEPAALEHARRIARDIDYGPFYELMEPVSGLHEVLAQLKRSYRLAMATNRGKTVSEVVRRFRLDDLLEFAVGVLDVPRPKPHPDMLEKCVTQFGVTPEQVVYVGDAATDLAAARAAGVHFIAVGAVADAAHRIDSLRELPARLHSL
jgi:HAD superfamily hydrolase (TIGR01509 family)